VFGFSFGEFMLICVVALVAVGPQKLPGVLRTLGQWIRKARNMVHDMRTQSGIDDLLRAEGLHGGLNELRGLVRSNTVNPFAQVAAAAASATGYSTTTPSAETQATHTADPYGGAVDIDATKEYPPEGPDAYGALPDDLADSGENEAILAAVPLENPWHTGPVPDAASNAAAQAHTATPSAEDGAGPEDSSASVPPTVA
jgi:sec-independent protein translocase protein TatB